MKRQKSENTRNDGVFRHKKKTKRKHNRQTFGAIFENAVLRREKFVHFITCANWQIMVEWKQPNQKIGDQEKGERKNGKRH